MRPSSSRLRLSAASAAAALALALGTTPAGAATAPGVATYATGPVVDVSSQCGTQNAEVETVTDQRLGYVYHVWMGCGISLARSTDGGATYGLPVSLPGSTGSTLNSWDPAIAVGPDGTVYVAFMVARSNQWYPVVDASYDHGQTFTQSTGLVPPDPKNWGDRVFLAVGPDGTVYVTWDYGPDRSTVTFVCASDGSCGYSTGQLNVVLQRSMDGGRTFSTMTPISPGYPASGGDSAPLVVEPSGRIDVLYQSYPILDTTTYALGLGSELFTSSTDGGATWSTPVKVGGSVGTMSLSEWWIDGDLGIDASGNLYATWDTQGTAADGTPTDTGWLSWSANGGVTWSAPVQAPADTLAAPHIMEVVGGPSGVAYVVWLSSSDPSGYALYLRTFRIGSGWLGGATRVSTDFGDPSVWPGDTVGLALLSPTKVVTAWGSAIPSGNKKSDIFAAPVGITLP